MERLVQYTDSELPSTFSTTNNIKEEEGEEEEEDVVVKIPLITSRYASSVEARRRMTRGLCEVLNDFGLVSFLPLDISDAATVAKVLAAIGILNYHIGKIMSCFKYDT